MDAVKSFAFVETAAMLPKRAALTYYDGSSLLHLCSL